MSFKSFIQEEELNEVLITFGNRPKFNQIVILAGGAGSGKGFITKKILGIDAKWIDVDRIKEMITDPGTPKLNKKILDLYGVDVTKMPMNDPENVKMLHQINKEMGISKKLQAQFFDNLPNQGDKYSKRLPNVVFDTTMKSEKKIKEIIETVTAAGYTNDNIHLIWVMNDVATAIVQNRDPERGRVVPEDILLDTHTGVSAVMQDLLRNSKLGKFIDGYAYVVFNKKDIDNVMVKSGLGGSWVEEALILEIKRRNKKQIAYTDIATHFLAKIKKYVPKATKRLWENSYKKCSG